MREKKIFQLASIAAMLKHFTFIYMWKGEEAEMRCEFPCHLHFGLSFSHTNTDKLSWHALPLSLALSLSLSSFTSKVSPPRCCATRTIIIKTKMFKIHFLCFFTHRRISAVLVCHLSCASSLSTSFTHTLTHTNTYASVNVQNSCLAYSCRAYNGPSTVAPKQTILLDIFMN